MIRTGSYLKDHRGVLMTGLALLSMALAPRPAWGQWQTNGSSIYYNNGAVGIGTNNPQAPLQVNGTFYRNLGAAQLQVGIAPALIQEAGAVGAADASAITTYAGQLQFWKRNAPGDFVAADLNLVLNSFGNVGIGTTNPQYKLAVNGNIGAQDIIVTNTGWSDYVFKPGYRLRPLSEVSAFIQKHHHLPDIPTEAEVKAQGVSLGEMQAKLLAKVEELTLHLIQQEKENKELRERLAQLENRVSANGDVASGR